MFSIIRLTVKEAFAKKTILFFFIVSTILCLLLMYALDIKISGFDSKSVISILGNSNIDFNSNEELTPEYVTRIIQSGIAVTIYIASLIFSLASTGNFFPNLLQKGVIDLILTKPISRTEIFVGRFLGAFLVVAANILYLTLFSALIIYFKFEIWNNGFILSSLVTLCVYGVLFALISFFGIIFRSSGLALVTTLGLMIFINPLLTLLKHFGQFSNVSEEVVDFFYYILPKISELGKMVVEITMQKDVETYLPFISSMIFGVVIFGVSLQIFKKKDF